MQQQAAIRKLLKQLSFFAPVTVYFCLFVAGSFICFTWLKQQPKLPGTPFHDIFALLMQITLYISMVFLSFGFASTLLSWTYFFLKIRKGKINFHITTRDFDTPYQPVELSLRPILRPVLGYIKLRFVYDNGDFSDKIQLVEDEHVNWFNQHLNGFYDWKIEDIREFRISRVVIYFEDFLQFFSLAIRLPVSERFFTPPQNQSVQAFPARERNTESKRDRIEEMRRVEGDLFNYKKFETNDDVRRIVWKIYAKSKQLMVRAPERMEPYASHLYLYVSFFSAYMYMHGELAQGPLLNFYKEKTWNIYKSIKSSGMDVRWISDQPEKSLSFSTHPSIEEEVKHLVSISDWQRDTDLPNFVQVKNAAVVVVSSLSNVQQVKLMATQYGREIRFVFVPLSKCFARQGIRGWLQWIFIKGEKDNDTRYRSIWAVSLLRREIVRNEKTLKKILTEID